MAPVSEREQKKNKYTLNSMIAHSGPLNALICDFKKMCYNINGREGRHLALPFFIPGLDLESKPDIIGDGKGAGPGCNTSPAPNQDRR
jgi:hypothetical protein